MMSLISWHIEPDAGNISPDHFIPDVFAVPVNRVSLGHGARPEGSVRLSPTGQPRWFCQCKLTCQFAQCIAISGTLM